MNISPEEIAAVMALAPLPHTHAELDELVVKGVPKGALKASVARVCLGSEARKNLLYQIIPEATYKRRRTILSPEESQRTERLARIFATARYVWDAEDEARQFLAAPHALLEGRTPLAVSMTELGARRVEQLLWKLYYGLPA